MNLIHWLLQNPAGLISQVGNEDTTWLEFSQVQPSIEKW